MSSIGDFFNRVWNGIKTGGQDVINSYTGGSSQAENIGGKAATAATGAVAGAKSGYKVAVKAVEEATTRTARHAAEKAIAKTVVSTSLKGAAKALGWVGFVPDAITFVKGFYKGYTAYGH